MTDDYQVKYQRSQVRVAELQQKIQQQETEALRNARLVGIVKLAMDEAITLAERVTKLKDLADPEYTNRLRKEAASLRRYFAEAKASSILVEQGFPAESVKHESTWTDAGEGREQGDTGQKHKTTRRKAAVSVDDTGGEG